MNASTNTTVETIAQNVPSDKLINYLLSTIEGAANPEEAYRKLVEATWEAATVENRKRVPASELAANNAKASTVLISCIEEARTVIYNTLRKLNHNDVPDSLRWACNPSAEIRVIGTFRHGSGFNSAPVNITHQLAEGKTVATDYDYVKFEIVRYGKSTEGTLSLDLLKGDPIAVAQYARRAVKGLAYQQAEAERRKQADELRTLIKQQSDLEKKAAQIQKEIDKVSKEKQRKQERAEKASARRTEGLATANR